MSITRWFPPFLPDDSPVRGHMPMDRNVHGPYVLFTDHITRMRDKDAKLEKALRRIKDLETTLEIRELLNE